MWLSRSVETSAGEAMPRGRLLKVVYIIVGLAMRRLSMDITLLCAELREFTLALLG